MGLYLMTITPFQSTPPVKAATLIDYVSSMGVDISIHAAREGGDVYVLGTAELTEISIHAAREGGDTYTAISTHTMRGFQSTPPVKAATVPPYPPPSADCHFNPRRP